MFRTEAIKALLSARTHHDLASLYTDAMECQVNVAPDDGERINGDFKGRKWHGWTNGVQTWKPFRIPLNAHAEPSYTDSQMSYDLSEHAEGIGMTGWDWKSRCSRWVAYDFDALTGHSDRHAKKMSDAEIESVTNALTALPWVTIRKSTGGKGLHVYVMLDKVPTANHTEHAALARAILGKMSALVGQDLHNKVDICGGNMWVWHRKMTRENEGLRLIKQGVTLVDIPINWRDHLVVVSGHRKKNLPHDIETQSCVDTFEHLTGQRVRIPLDEQHKKLITWLKDNKCLWWWDQDHHMLVTHTYHLKEAHSTLCLRGLYDTLAVGTERGNDHNCFCFPMRDGAWSVRRYSRGVAESISWSQDGAGWTRCYFNRTSDLGTICKFYGGLEDPSGGYVFSDKEKVSQAIKALGATVNIPDLQHRSIKLKEHDDKRLVLETEQTHPTERLDGWLLKRKKFLTVVDANIGEAGEPDLTNYDDMIRHLVSEDEDCGWVINSENHWRLEPKHHVADALKSTGIPPPEVTNILGTAILRPFKIVNKPFELEYPGNREWNRNAAQIRFVPNQSRDTLWYPTWKSVLEHCGESLNEALKANEWAKANDVLTGLDYLKIWIASLFKYPQRHLPYLFMYGRPQNSGKSTFHESLSLLLTKGYQRADAALVNPSGFNAELEGAILCIVEETDISRNRDAYQRIKDWVTSTDILIHPKGATPYHAKNYTHWIQCSNDHKFCPIFPGDTRVTICEVQSLKNLIPKDQLRALLEKEAPDFLAEILNLEIPESNDRLGVPALETREKHSIEQMYASPVDLFVEAMLVECPGAYIKSSDFYDRFQLSLDDVERSKWSKIRVGKELAPRLMKGRLANATHALGNVKWVDDENTKPSKIFVLDEKGFMRQ